ncbi:MAG: hypothetical protein HGB12_14005 [Bacteroidetes bacterium]|nr:hypothetical protein [Bacteroidota bacterium]
MKKIVLVLIIASSFTFANAQSNKATSITSATVSNKTAAQVAQPTKTAINVTELQKSITDNIAKDYVGYKTIEAYKYDNGAIAYEAVVEKDAKKVYLYYERNGILIHKKDQAETKSEPVTPKTTIPNK